MQRVAFKMKLFTGKKEEYIRRHNEIWPELVELLKGSGIAQYSIFLDESTHSLFGVLQIENKAMMDALPQHAVMQRWWAYMSDLMETHPDRSPVSIPLEEVFYLP